MVVRTAQRLGETSSGVPTIQHARADQGPGLMETRLRCAQPAKNGQYDGCISVPKRRLLQRSDRNVIKSAASLAVPGGKSAALTRSHSMSVAHHPNFYLPRRLLGTTATELRRFGGIGPAKAALLLAVSELCQRSLAEKTRDPPLLDAPQAVEDYLKWLIGTRPNEVFV